MVDLSELLIEIKDLSEIPEFACSIKHKVEEMKIALSPYIHLHREVKSILNEWLGEKTAEIQGQPFELTKIGTNLWIPSIANLYSEYDIYEVIPEKLIKYIVSQDSPMGVIVMKKNFSLKSIKDRTFDLCFEKISSDYIVGIINEQGGAKKTINWQGNLKGGFSTISPQEKYQLIKKLIHYMSTNEVFFQHIASEFQTRWLPLLESQHMEINEE